MSFFVAFAGDENVALFQRIIWRGRDKNRIADDRAQTQLAGVWAALLAPTASSPPPVWQ